MSRSHSFSVDVAGAYSVDVALMLNHITFWYQKVVSDGVNKHENEHWVRMKLTQMQMQFPYWSVEKIRRILKTMLSEKLIKKGEFNDKKNDRTKWYTLTQKSKNLLNISDSKTGVKNTKKAMQNVSVESDVYLSVESDSRSVESDTSIYKEVDIKYRYIVLLEKIRNNYELIESCAMKNKLKIETVKNNISVFAKWSVSVQEKYNNEGELFRHFAGWIKAQNLSDENLDKELDWFINSFNKISNRTFIATESIRKNFALQFSNGFKSDQFKKAIENLFSSSPKNKFHLETAFKFATPDYLLKGDNLNKYSNFKL